MIFKGIYRALEDSGGRRELPTFRPTLYGDGGSESPKKAERDYQRRIGVRLGADRQTCVRREFDQIRDRPRTARDGF